MDFADAKLVVLAKDLGTNLVLTTDQREAAERLWTAEG